METKLTQLEKASLLASQPSDIHTLPSHNYDDDDHDDSDSDVSDLLSANNNSPDNVEEETSCRSNNSNDSFTYRNISNSSLVSLSVETDHLERIESHVFKDSEKEAEESDRKAEEDELSESSALAALYEDVFKDLCEWKELEHSAVEESVLDDELHVIVAETARPEATVGNAQLVAFDGDNVTFMSNEIIEPLLGSNSSGVSTSELEPAGGVQVICREDGEKGESDDMNNPQASSDKAIGETNSYKEGEEKEPFNSVALADFLKVTTDSAKPDSGTIPTAPQSEEKLCEEEKKELQHIHHLRVKFLRLVHRLLGHKADDFRVAQVLYNLDFLMGRPTSPTFSVDNAKQTAMHLEEAQGEDDLNFSLNILVLGKSGVGKSATINSIFGEEKVKINAFEPETTSVRAISGMVEGIKILVIDSPGLRSSMKEQGFNRKVLASIRKVTKKYPPDIMLYVDRLDSQTRDSNDLPMLRTITSSLGCSIWDSAIVTLTHACRAPPDGSCGLQLSYDVYVARRSNIVQQSIVQAVGDLSFTNPSLVTPICLVENHPGCRMNREGHRVLPNGQAWRPLLLLKCCSLKILSEAGFTSKSRNPVDPLKLFGCQLQLPFLSQLLSLLFQPSTHPNLPADNNGDSDIDLEDDLSCSDKEDEEDEYDQLPPFKPLRKSQIAKLSRDQRKSYFDEYDYRIKLLQKKQWREELKDRKIMREIRKKGNSCMNNYSEITEGNLVAVPDPLPDSDLPPSFRSDNPSYLYQSMEPTLELMTSPLGHQVWDCGFGFDGLIIEKNTGIAGRFPAAVAVQVRKDKKYFNIHLDSTVAAKHGENGSSAIGLDIRTLGKQHAYIIKGESKFKNLKKNKTTAGVSVTFLGKDVATGVKLENQINLGKSLALLGSIGSVRSQNTAINGANLEVVLRQPEYPLRQDRSSFVLSMMKSEGELGMGAIFQSQFSVGRSSKMAISVGLNNKHTGQITVRTSSSSHLLLVLASLIPIVVSIFRKLRPRATEVHPFN